MAAKGLLAATRVPPRRLLGRSRSLDTATREPVALRRAELQQKLAASYVKLWERNEAHARRALEQAQTEHARWQARLAEFTQRVSLLQAEARIIGRRNER